MARERLLTSASRLWADFSRAPSAAAPAARSLREAASRTAKSSAPSALIQRLICSGDGTAGGAAAGAEEKESHRARTARQVRAADTTASGSRLGATWTSRMVAVATGGEQVLTEGNRESRARSS